MRLSLAVAAGLAAAAFTAFAVLAAFVAEQSSTGVLSVAIADVSMYICEPASTPGPACGSDDSGPDEVIFEGDENLTPGDEITADLRIKNEAATLPWDIGGFSIVFTEVNDPGSDCNAIPTAVPRILGKGNDALNDNHFPPFGGEWDAGMRPENFSPSADLLVHIDPGDYEDLRLHVLLPDFGTECSQNEWSIAVAWTAYDEGSAPKHIVF